MCPMLFIGEARRRIEGADRLINSLGPDAKKPCGDQFFRRDRIQAGDRQTSRPRSVQR